MFCIFREFVILKNDCVNVFGVNVMSLLMFEMLKCFICFWEIVDVEWGVLRIDLLKLKIDLMFWLGRFLREFVIWIFLMFFFLIFVFFWVKVCDDSVIVVVIVKVFVRGDKLNVVFFMVFLLFLVVFF